MMPSISCDLDVKTEEAAFSLHYFLVLVAFFTVDNPI